MEEVHREHDYRGDMSSYIQDQEKNRKNPYQAPQLRRYGSLRQLTTMMLRPKGGMRRDGFMMAPRTRL